MTEDARYRGMKDFRRIYRTEGAYHSQAGGFTAWFLHDNYAAIAARCRPGDVILDLACGEGCLAAYLEAERLVGIDHSRDALDHNRRLFPGAYHELLPGDMRRLETLSLPPASFHRVVCSLSLMYLVDDDLERCIADVALLLRPGGAFVFTYPTVSRHRAGSTTAAELPCHELHARLAGAGFRGLMFHPICPLVPGAVVDQSMHPDTSDQAREVYDAATRVMTLEHCYHWLCQARVAG